MENRIGQLIQAYDSEGNPLGLFRFTTNQCPIDHVEPVITEYLELLDTAISALGESDEEVIKLRKLETVLDNKDNLLNEQKLIVIIKHKNEGWTPDWNNSDEIKYYPYFYMEEDSFRFDNSYYWTMLSSASARLCFKNKDTLLELIKEPEILEYYRLFLNK